MDKTQKKSGSELILQLLLNFVLPLIVLTRFSSDTSLGPTKGLVLALSFPVVYELYNVIKYKKLSWLSVVSISGILITGLISLLKLSVGWLALRRSIPYAVIASGIIIAEGFRYSPAEKIAEQILDIKKIKSAINSPEVSLKNLFKKCSYLAAALFATIAAVSYILTRLVITSPLDTPEFNQQYASLRIWSIVAITIPLLAGIVAIVMYLVSKLEKETKLDAETFMKR